MINALPIQTTAIVAWLVSRLFETANSLVAAGDVANGHEMAWIASRLGEDSTSATPEGLVSAATDLAAAQAAQAGTDMSDERLASFWVAIEMIDRDAHTFRSFPTDFSKGAQDRLWKQSEPWIL